MGLAASSMPLSALAHRRKRAVSTIEWDTSKKLLQVTHELHLHDAEQGLNRLGKIANPDLSPLRARAQLALYVQEHFKISEQNGKNIPLEIIGAEVDSTYVYIYQEVELQHVPQKLQIKNSILQDIYIDQTNLVNVILGEDLNSLIFVAGDKAKQI